MTTKKLILAMAVLGMTIGGISYAPQAFAAEDQKHEHKEDDGDHEDHKDGAHDHADDKDHEHAESDSHDHQDEEHKDAGAKNDKK